MPIKSGFYRQRKRGRKMLQNVLVKTVGEFGIFKSFLGTFNVVNLKTKQIASTMNFLSVDEAEKYIEQGVSY